MLIEVIFYCFNNWMLYKSTKVANSVGFLIQDRCIVEKTVLYNIYIYIYQTETKKKYFTLHFWMVSMPSGDLFYYNKNV